MPNYSRQKPNISFLEIWLSPFFESLLLCDVTSLALLQYFTVGQKIKKVQAKKLVKFNKSISRCFFYQILHFWQFQKWPKINFWTGKKFKTDKNAISRNLFIWFHEFFAWTFLNFLARCVIPGSPSSAPSYYHIYSSIRNESLIRTSYLLPKIILCCWYIQFYQYTYVHIKIYAKERDKKGCVRIYKYTCHT